MAHKSIEYLLNTTGRAAVTHDVPIENVQKTTPKQKKETEKQIEKELAPRVLVPRFNKLYSTLRENDSLAYVADGWSTGGFNLPVAASGGVVINLTINKNTPFRPGQWPGGTQVYVAILSFFLVSDSSDTGGVQCVINDPSGAGIVVGVGSLSGGGIASYPRIMCPNPVTDMLNNSDQTFSFGTLTATGLGNSIALACNYGITWSYVYLLPAREGYEVKNV